MIVSLKLQYLFILCLYALFELTKHKDISMKGFDTNTCFSIAGKYDLSNDYLNSIHAVVNRHLARFTRVTILRFDLRFPAYLQSDDTAVISRFIEAFKSRLRAWKDRRASVHPIGFGYIWCREQVDGTGNWHYHVAFVFNKDAVFTFGTQVLGEDNTYNRIFGAWASALGLNVQYAIGLVHICQNGVYWLDQNAADFVMHYDAGMNRLSYLAKKETKYIGDGNRHFGSSQKIFMG